MFACRESSRGSGSEIIARDMICTSARFEEAACVLLVKMSLTGATFCFQVLQSEVRQT